MYGNTFNNPHTHKKENAWKHIPCYSIVQMYAYGKSLSHILEDNLWHNFKSNRKYNNYYAEVQRKPLHIKKHFMKMLISHHFIAIFLYKKLKCAKKLYLFAIYGFCHSIIFYFTTAFFWATSITFGNPSINDGMAAIWN